MWAGTSCSVSHWAVDPAELSDELDGEGALNIYVWWMLRKLACYVGDGDGSDADADSDVDADGECHGVCMIEVGMSEHSAIALVAWSPTATY